MPNIQLCNYTGDPRVLEKNVVTGNSINCSIYGECSIHNPKVIIQYFSGVEQFNYAKMFDRCYFIEDMIFASGKRVELTLREDVLTTHAAEIKKLKAYVVRQEKVGQPLLVDSEYPALVTNNITRLYFSETPFAQGNDSYMLTVIGGGYRA